MMLRIDAHAVAKNTFSEDFSVQKCLTIISPSIHNFPDINHFFLIFSQLLDV